MRSGACLCSWDSGCGHQYKTTSPRSWDLSPSPRGVSKVVGK